MRLGTMYVDEALLPVTGITLANGAFRVEAAGYVQSRVEQGSNVIVLRAPDGTEVAASRADLFIRQGHADPGEFLVVTITLTALTVNEWEQRRR